MPVINFCTSVLFTLTFIPSVAQLYYRHTYFDKVQCVIKSVYQVQDTISNIYEGTFQSFFESGRLASSGQFEKNQATGNWEFYHENGVLKMKGPYRHNINTGAWEFFFETGVKSMEGELNNNSKEGLWKLYYESGKLKETGNYRNNIRIGEWKIFYEQGDLKSKTIYQNATGRVTEIYSSGKKKGEGMQEDLLKTGDWKYYNEEGKLMSEGTYREGQRSGQWIEFFENGKVSSQGMYAHDEPVGNWAYFFEDGKISDRGAFDQGKKAGLWQSFSLGGMLKSEVEYKPSTGEYIEYYPSHKIKMKGQFENNKRNGWWTFYSETGTREGECQYTEGKGIFTGYYPNGVLKNKGNVEDDLRVGQWELYDANGKLTGYYTPVYQEPVVRIQSPERALKERVPAKNSGHFQFFTARYPEYKSVIISANPIFSLLGYIPFNLEFYTQERVAYEFMWESIRSPFFTSDKNVPALKIYTRGASFRFRQKFYFPTKYGMLYVSHAIGTVSLQHLINHLPPVKNVFALEQIYEYGVMVGDRLMRQNDRDGFTIDAYVGYFVGIRRFTDEPGSVGAFDALDQDKFAPSFRFGLTFGYSISFSRK